MSMHKVATLPVSFLAENIADRNTLVPVPGVNYTNPKTTPFPKNELHHATDGTTYEANSRGGDDLTYSGCIWSGTSAGGLQLTRVGTNNATSCVKTAATGVASGVAFHSIAAGDWLGTATAPCLPNVIGLSWLWDWQTSMGSQSYDRSTYPTKAALMYTDRNLDRQAYPLDVYSAGGVLGTPYNCGREGKFFSYRLSNTNWNKVVDRNDPLFFMGVVFQFKSNHGSGTQTLAGTVWDAVPVVTSYEAGHGLYTDWSTNSDPLYMTVKEQHAISRLDPNEPDRMYALQTG